ncbi:MAG: heme NO-binding domain-containing protein [Pseudomonadota bacterium]
MHGLINKSIQSFLSDTYGPEVWQASVRGAGLPISGFEALVIYDDDMTLAVVDAAGGQLEKTREELLEDLGNYLVSHKNLEPLRRLLRFGGVNFVEFLYSLDDLHDRARLAVPDLELPHLALEDLGNGEFRLCSSFRVPGFGHILVGLLRSMADDYGALVFLNYERSEGAREFLKITLLESQFAKGRVFELAARVG